MKIDIYKNRKRKSKSKTKELAEILEDIRTNPQYKNKRERYGMVYATTTNFGRKHKHIKSYNGLIFIDVDHCINPEKVKEILSSLDCTIATWYSSSGKGVHAIMKISKATSLSTYRRRWDALYERLVEIIGFWGEVDRITRNPTQLSFVSYDPDIIIRPFPVTFKRMKRRPKPKNRTKPRICTSETTPKEVIEWIDATIPKIESPGYTQLIKYAYTLGGFASGGAINPEDALEALYSAIEQNPYFLLGGSSDSSINNYIKGGEDCFREGMNEPLEWETSAEQDFLNN